MSVETSRAFGEPLSGERPDADRLAALARHGRERALALRALPIDRILDGLGQLRPLWGRGGTYRELFLRQRAGEFAGRADSGRAQPMIELALDRFAAALVPGLLRRRLASQLGDPAALDRFVPNNGRTMRAEPLGTVLHVVSGDVFVEPVELMISGLLTKNASVMKCPLGQESFLRLFQKSLEEVAPDLATATAVLAWSGGDAEIDTALAAHVDGIVVSAPAHTVATYRRVASPATQLIELGPRVSLAVVSLRGVDSLIPAALARDVALWDQLASTAAQVVYVQGAPAAQSTAEQLAGALDELEAELPSSAGTLNERIEIARVRDAARFQQLSGAARLYASTAQALWTVVYEDDRRFTSSPLRRTVRVKPFGSLTELAALLEPFRGALQTAGIQVAGDERADYLDHLSRAGVRRICSIGRMNLPAIDELRDGTMELHRLVRWVEGGA